jgi:hypothetical protein
MKRLPKSFFPCHESLRFESKPCHVSLRFLLLDLLYVYSTYTSMDELQHLRWMTVSVLVRFMERSWKVGIPHSLFVEHLQ